MRIYIDKTGYLNDLEKKTEEVAIAYTAEEVKALEKAGYHVVTDSDVGQGGEV